MDGAFVSAPLDHLYLEPNALQDLSLNPFAGNELNELNEIVPILLNHTIPDTTPPVPTSFSVDLQKARIIVSFSKQVKEYMNTHVFKRT